MTREAATGVKSRGTRVVVVVVVYPYGACALPDRRHTYRVRGFFNCLHPRASTEPAASRPRPTLDGKRHRAARRLPVGAAFEGTETLRADHPRRGLGTCAMWRRKHTVHARGETVARRAHRRLRVSLFRYPNRRRALRPVTPSTHARERFVPALTRSSPLCLLRRSVCSPLSPLRRARGSDWKWRGITSSCCCAALKLHPSRVMITSSNSRGERFVEIVHGLLLRLDHLTVAPCLSPDVSLHRRIHVFHCWMLRACVSSSSWWTMRRDSRR